MAAAMAAAPRAGKAPRMHREEDAMTPTMSEWLLPRMLARLSAPSAAASGGAACALPSDRSIPPNPPMPPIPPIPPMPISPARAGAEARRVPASGEAGGGERCRRAPRDVALRS
ncbi:MAG: hypothetical protein Kow0058_07470 [Roseovarius sp.]